MALFTVFLCEEEAPPIPLALSKVAGDRSSILSSLKGDWGWE
jgi:hypothetical protein